jgi:non-ribosomal peptide synthetase component E (peptide arylation enzyme)
MLVAAREKLNCLVINAFGSSEGTNITTRLNDSLDIILGSVGRPACPYDTIKIIDEAGNEVPREAEGELVSKGPGVFTGYFKSPEENSQIFTKDGFFKTGDRARKDRDGNITITGRIKDIINRGGEKISALDIENRLTAHPPDAVLGERICAYVRVKANGAISFEEIIAFLKSGGASVQQLPERIEFVGELPVTKVGKIDKKVLREDIGRRLQAGK